MENYYLAESLRKKELLPAKYFHYVHQWTLEGNKKQKKELLLPFILSYLRQRIFEK